MQTIIPFLWFDGQAEEAAEFYTSIVKDSKILKISRYGDVGPGPKGTAMTVDFELKGQEFVALNGGPVFAFTPAVSFMINCADQEEVDYLWKKFTEEGKESQCGWLTDKFGLSWQITPVRLRQLLEDTDPKKAGRVMQAMIKMKKINIAALEEAYNGS